MSANQKRSVQLGFVEDQDDWLLTSRFFPSKIGNHPAWLELQNIPESRDVLCDYCQEPCLFLCQIYAGSESAAQAFHRTVFVFICKKGECCSLNQAGNIKVLRSQLPLHNKFYPDKPADESTKCDAMEMLVKLCKLCGCRGGMVCGKCKCVSYCGASHQKLDWKQHKQHCGRPGVQADSEPPSEHLFPEFEIVIEQEEEQVAERNESEKEAEKRRLREYEDLVSQGQSGVMAECSDADLNAFTESKEDKTFGKFKKVIESYETQVVRYNRHGSPLWISDQGILGKNAVPNCPLCKGPRSFEFQIMPQMLNELKNYELDWGIIAVYTCERDCDTGEKYAAEFCYKQDIKNEDEDGEINLDKMKLEKKVKPVEASAMLMDDQPLPTQPAEKLCKSKAKQKSKPKPAESRKKAFEDDDENWE